MRGVALLVVVRNVVHGETTFASGVAVMENGLRNAKPHKQDAEERENDADDAGASCHGKGHNGPEDTEDRRKECADEPHSRGAAPRFNAFQ
ncbi:hypothetical protein SDC9_187716 [bioreactor metagenome]|uniref:Uncharacterized protein n=1 Tax=bioreactor metagenome TaxID=1076179 RepID=A0A645HMY2_9ZZZZ